MMRMRLPVALAALALLVPAFAGCMEKAADDSIKPDSTTSGLTPPGGLDLPKEPQKTPIAVAFTTTKEWIKPGTDVTLSTDVTGDGLKYLWQYGSRKGDAGEMDTGVIDAGKRDDLTFTKAGSYLLHCHPHPWMKMTVNVQDGAATSDIAHVAILDDGKDDSTFRFAPAKLTVAPGTQIIFWNNGTMVHTATLEKYDEPLVDIPGNGPEVSFNFPAAGDFRVVLTITDAKNGFGQAEKRILVNDAAPSDVFTATFSGEMPLALSDEPAAQAYTDGIKTHPFKLDYAGKLTATVASTTDTPVPHQVQISLLPAGQDKPLAQTQPGPDGSFTIDVPAGGYVLEVRGIQGAQVKYTTTLQALLEIPLPAEESEGGHEHGGGHHH